MKKFFTGNRLIAGIVVVVLVMGGGIYWYIASSQAPSFSAITVATGNVVSSVDVAGNVLSENSVDLSFEEAGTITRVPVSEGNAVAAGATLVSLDTASLEAGVEQAQAALSAAQAKLDELQVGTRPEQLQIDESAVTEAQTSLSASLASAYAAADDAVRNQIDNLFTNPDGNGPIFNVPTSNSQLVINIQSQRQAIGGALTAWYTAQSTASSSSESPSSLSNVANATLAQVQSYLDAVALAVNGASANAIPAATLTQDKLDVVTARNEVNATVTALTAAEAAFTNAQNTLTLANAGATPQDIEAQKASVLQAQAAVASAEVAFSNASIVAPFAGTVRNLTAKIGQVVTPGVPVVSLTNNQGLKIVGYVSEADVANVKQGEGAVITLDAYGTGTTFPATVTTVDSSETTVNGTPEYKVTLHFVNADDRLKDGMTGNIHIITAEHDNVLEVPSNLVINNNNNYFVLVTSGNATVQEPVTIGLTGDDGMTEITSGLNAGDKIINF